MDKPSKRATSTGNLPSIRTGKGSTASAPETTILPSLTGKISPKSKTAPILEGSLNTGKSNNANHLAVMIAIQDFMTVKKRLPLSWIGSSKGKIFMCIDGAGTGKYSIADGKICYEGFPVEDILEKTLEKQK